MKCISCDKEAEYMYLGNSYCEEHKNKHKITIESLVDKQRKEDLRQEGKKQPELCLGFIGNQPKS